MFNALPKDDFLTQYWQQKAHVFRDAMSDLVGLIEGDELAGLACEESAESRVIKGREEHGKWCCEQGPFAEEYFGQLPKEDWTLLVQGVDQWFEEVHNILARFDFLPQWRLEDIMASYAPVGGGVGPHFDYYDVFLIQISGSRQWRLGQTCDAASPLQTNSEVKLLDEFITEETHELNPGDMLYVPAGKAHWGVASSDDCITFSVGFRAPSEKELLSSVLEHLVDTLSDNHRYKDTLQSIDQDPAKINGAVQNQVQQLMASLTPERIQQAAAQVFGELVTEPRHCALEEGEGEESSNSIITSALKQQTDITLWVPAHTRLAYSDQYLFVNGEAYNAHEDFAQAVCQAYLPHSLLNSANILILEALISQGDLALIE